MFTGKGGVGKSTVAAASALAAAEAGQRVAVISTDPAHSLADVLGRAVGTEAVQVTPGCHAQQLDARLRMEQSWAEVGGWLHRAFAWAGLDDLMAEELTLLPGLEELFALSEVTRLAEAGRFDAVMVDCAPTAETLRLLALPEVIGLYLDRADARGGLRGLARDAARRLGDFPAPDASMSRAVRSLTGELAALRRLLAADDTSVRLVTTAERVVLAETRRTFSALSLFGYSVDAVVVNRLVPPDDHPLLAGWRARQGDALREVADAFGDAPVLTAGLLADEPVGVEALLELAAATYGSRCPSDRLASLRPMRVVDGAEGPELHLSLPSASSDAVEVFTRDDDLTLTVGAHRRTLLVPQAMRGRPVLGASLREGTLVVRFGPTDILDT